MFANLPVTDPEVVKRLYPEVQTSKNSRDELVRQHMRLAIYIAKQLAPCRQDVPEFVAEAMLALVSAVERLKPIENGNATNFLGASIRYQLYDLRVKNRMFSVTRGAFQNRLAQGLKPVSVKIEADSSKVGNQEEESSQVSFSWAEPVVTDHNTSQLEVNDVLSHCGLTESERIVLDLRMAGNNDAEIGRILNVTRARVGQIRHSIGAKYVGATGSSATGSATGPSATGRGKLESRVQSSACTSAECMGHPERSETGIAED